MEPETYNVPLELADITLLEALIDRAMEDWAREGLPDDAVFAELRLRYRLQRVRLQILEWES